MLDIISNSNDLSVFTSLGGYLKSFSDITQIDILFYGLSGILVHNNHVYNDDKSIQEQLDTHNMMTYTIFPITVNEKVWGFVLCRSDSVSKQRIVLSREYITNILQQLFEDSPTPVSTSALNPLTGDEFSQINYLSVLLKLSANKTDSSNETSELNFANQIESYNSLKKAIDFVLSNLTRNFSLNDVANKAFLSPSYLSRLFKKYLHVTFIDYVNHLKIAQAKERLALTTVPVSVISNDIGFSQTSYFTKTFKKLVKTTPSAFRRKNSATTKIFTIPHTLEWQQGATVFDVSKKYFNSAGIDFFYQSTNGFLYVNSIDNLTDSSSNAGWLFSIDGQQPESPADNITVDTVSEIQWIYTDLTNF